MSLYNKDELNKVEELKSKLFNKNYKAKIEHRDSFPHFKTKEDVADSWHTDDVKSNTIKNLTMKTSVFRKIFIFSIVFFILSAGYASYMFFFGDNIVSNDNIDIAVKSNAFADGGEEYSLLLEIINRNSVSLDLADIVLEYSKNSITTLSQASEYFRVSLGTIPAGSIRSENIKLTFFGEPGSVREIKISLEYRVEGSNAIFVKNKIFEVTINSTPIDLLINAPSGVSSNQDFNLDIKSTLNAVKPLSKVLVRIDYPIGFQFINAIPKPAFGDNVWNLGDLAPGVVRTISINGKMIDVADGEEKVFRIWSGSQSPSDKFAIGTFLNSLEHTILIVKASIETKIFINEVAKREYAIDTKTQGSVRIQWQNNLETNINNLEIRAIISGNALDRRSISARQGFYNSIQNTIVWDRNSNKKLTQISPGESDFVSFSFSTLPIFKVGEGIINSPVVNMDVLITGELIESNGAVVQLANKESRTVKIISDVGFSSKVFHYSGPFQNTGPIPPKVEKKTTYTITWSLSNTANNVSKGEVRSTLPVWVRFMNAVFPAVEDLVYNNATREIIWNVGEISKGSGIESNPREVSFQVELLPSLSQRNTAPLILNNSVFTGYDNFANVNVQTQKTPLDIRIISDPDFPIFGNIVTE